jgi:hypothetical protein
MLPVKKQKRGNRRKYLFLTGFVMNTTLVQTPKKPSVKRTFKPTTYLVAVAILLSGCTANGDFDRERRSLLLESVADKLTFVRSKVLKRESSFLLTQNETRLRESVRYLRKPIPHNPTHPFSVRSIDSHSYAEHISLASYTHSPARIKAIKADMEQDSTVFSKFTESARMVMDDDRLRTLIVQDKKSVYTPADKMDIEFRVKENRQMIVAGFRTMRNRINGYDYAIERSKIEAPGENISAAEATLDLLREQVADFRTEIQLYEVEQRAEDAEPNNAEKLVATVKNRVRKLQDMEF